MLGGSAVVGYQLEEAWGNHRLSIVGQYSSGTQVLAAARRSAACSLDAFVDFAAACRHGSVVVEGVAGQALLESQLGFDRQHRSRDCWKVRGRSSKPGSNSFLRPWLPGVAAWGL